MGSRIAQTLGGIVVAAVGSVAASCGGGDATSDCALGREGCPCLGDVCNNGLFCNAGVCEAPADATTSESDSDTPSETGPTSSVSTTSDEGTTENVDTTSATTPVDTTSDPTDDSAESSSTGSPDCVPQSDPQFCVTQRSACGVTEASDNCDEPRSVDCGGCGTEESCTPPPAEAVSSHDCIPRAQCLAVQTPLCCESQASAFEACALDQCGFLGFNEQCLGGCEQEIVEWSDCILYDCPEVLECGTLCEDFCTSVLDGCAPGPTYAECMNLCDNYPELPLEFGCGIALDCTYNGICDNIPSSVCAEGLWRCEDELECIDDALVCDGNADCTDATDEDNAECASGCDDDERRCDDVCVPCPTDAGIASVACEAGACVVDTCDAGFAICDGSCCSMQVVVVDADDGDYPRLTEAADGSLHMCYELTAQFADEQRKYAAGTADGASWDPEIAWNLGGLGLLCDIYVHDDGVVYIGSTMEYGEYSILRRTAGDWDELVIPTFWTAEAVLPYISVDAVENVRVLVRSDGGTYYAIVYDGMDFGFDSFSQQPTEIERGPDGILHGGDRDGFDVRHRSWDGVAWTIEIVINTSPDLPTVRDVAVDEAGNPHFALGVDGVLYWAHRELGMWTVEAVDSPGNNARIAIHDPANPYFHVIVDEVGYIVARNGDGWAASQLPGPQDNGDIAITANGLPIVCYHNTDDETLECAYMG